MDLINQLWPIFLDYLDKIVLYTHAAVLMADKWCILAVTIFICLIWIFDAKNKFSKAYRIITSIALNILIFYFVSSVL